MTWHDEDTPFIYILPPKIRFMSCSIHIGSDNISNEENGTKNGKRQRLLVRPFSYNDYVRQEHKSEKREDPAIKRKRTQVIRGTIHRRFPLPGSFEIVLRKYYLEKEGSKANGENVIDFRLFINGRPSQKGLFVPFTDWDAFYNKIVEFNDAINNEREVKQLREDEKFMEKDPLSDQVRFVTSYEKQGANLRKNRTYEV